MKLEGTLIIIVLFFIVCIALSTKLSAFEKLTGSDAFELEAIQHDCQKEFGKECVMVFEFVPVGESDYE